MFSFSGSRRRLSRTFDSLDGTVPTRHPLRPISFWALSLMAPFWAKDGAFHVPSQIVSWLRPCHRCTVFPSRLSWMLLFISVIDRPPGGATSAVISGICRICQLIDGLLSFTEPAHTWGRPGRPRNRRSSVMMRRAGKFPMSSFVRIILT